MTANQLNALIDVKIAVKQFIPGALTEDDEFTVSIYDKGPDNRPSEADAPAALAFEVVLSNGEDNDINANFSYVKAFVKKVAPPNQDGNGDRKATIDVTFRPTGEQPAAASSGTSGGTSGGTGTGTGTGT